MFRQGVGRGGVQADLDQDGRVDLVILVHGGEAIILQNVSEPVGTEEVHKQAPADRTLTFTHDTEYPL